jgi:putative aldouronate transport system permease protein
MIVRKKRFSISDIILNFIFMVAVFLCLYPVLLLIGISFSSEKDIVQYGFSVIPRTFTLYAYEFILKSSKMLFQAYGVTILVTVSGTFLCMLLTTLYAYPLSRKEFKFRKPFTLFIFFTMLLNGGLVPWYFVCVRVLHINDKIWALILPYLMNGFYVIVMRTFFKTNIPDEIIESARIDGSGEFYTFFRIVIPLAVPGIATIGLFAALQYWNDYFLPLMLINNQKLDNLQFMMYKVLMTLEMIQNTPVGAVSDVYQRLPGETARMALAFLSMGPIVLAYPFFQKFFIKGLTIGAVKG